MNPIRVGFTNNPEEMQISLPLSNLRVKNGCLNQQPNYNHWRDSVGKAVSSGRNHVSGHSLSGPMIHVTLSGNSYNLDLVKVGKCPSAALLSWLGFFNSSIHVSTHLANIPWAFALCSVGIQWYNGSCWFYPQDLFPSFSLPKGNFPWLWFRRDYLYLLS